MSISNFGGKVRGSPAHGRAQPAVLARSPATSYADSMTKPTPTTNDLFQAACKQLYDELLDPESPLFTDRLAHPAYPDTPGVRELSGAPSILVPLQTIMFSCINWSASWPSRFAEIGLLRELARGPWYGAKVAAEHLEVYDAQQISIPGRKRTVAFSDLARGAGGRDSRGRTAQMLVRDIVIFQLVDLFKPCKLRGSALWDAVTRVLEFGLPGVDVPGNLRLVVKRMSDRLGDVPDELMLEDLLPDGERDGSWEEAEVLESVERKAEEREQFQPMNVLDPEHIRRLPYDDEEHPGEPEDETIGLLRGPYATWGHGVRELAENAPTDVMDQIETAIANDETTWRPLAEGAQTSGLDVAELVERLVSAVSWYPATSSILRSYRFERPLWQELIDVDGPTAPYARAVLELYGRWTWQPPESTESVRLVDVPSAFKAADKRASVGVGLDAIAVVLVRQVLLDVVDSKDAWPIVDEMLSFVRNPHRLDHALAMDDALENTGENRLSGVSRKGLRTYHSLGLAILEELGIERAR